MYSRVYIMFLYKFCFIIYRPYWERFSYELKRFSLFRNTCTYKSCMDNYERLSNKYNQKLESNIKEMDISVQR